MIKKNSVDIMPRSFLVKQKMHLDECLAKQEVLDNEEETKAGRIMNEKNNHQVEEDVSKKDHENESPHYAYEVPVVYQPVSILDSGGTPQYYIATRDFWSTRFPFYVKQGRTYSPDNHLDQDTRERSRETVVTPLEQSRRIVPATQRPTYYYQQPQQRSFAVDDFKGRTSEASAKLIHDTENNNVKLVESNFEVDSKDTSEASEDIVAVQRPVLMSAFREDSSLTEAIGLEIKKSRRPRKSKNARQYACKYCEKDYMTLGALKMHIRTHTLPCKCHICGKAFSRPWLLQGHVRTHTGERPFACSYCGRAFADRSNLRAHIQTHADIKRLHECQNCMKTFTRAPALSKHEVECYKQRRVKIAIA